MFGKRGKKGYAFAWGQIIGWIIAILVAAGVIIAIFVLRGKAGGGLSFIRDFFRAF
jgi:hypothetical protein